MAENYRENVAAIIINKDKKVLMCEHVWIDNAWQLPQGGVDKGESKEEALLRELEEELGTNKFKIISKMDESLVYKFPYYLREKYDSEGQRQTFFLVLFTGEDSELRFDNQEKPEFQSFEWVDWDVPPKRVIYFKKLSYLAAFNYFKETYDSLNIDQYLEQNVQKI
jgi:putative (di)nucleoside polyphosphate hydrolase